MAHGDTGAIDPVLVAPVEGRLAIDVQVVVTYTNDQERADGATVTAVAVAPDLTATPAVTLEPATAPGAYVGVLDVPVAGTWTVRIESTSPTAAVEVSAVEVIDATTTTADVATTTTPTVATAPDPLLPDDDGPVWGGIAAVLGVLLAIGSAIAYRLSRRRQARP